MAFKRLDNKPGQTSDADSNDFEQMLAESFEQSDRKVSVGDKIKCEVMAVGKDQVVFSTGTRFDGFVPASEMNDDAGPITVNVGDTIELFVTYIKGTTLSLSPKPVGRNGRPQQARATLGAHHKVGDVVNGTVTRITDFGAFIEIAPGVDGLAHISQLSWARVKSPADVVKVGEKVSATILSIEEGDRRQKISLSLKSASGDPWKNLAPDIQTGRVVRGKVTRLMAFGAFVELLSGVEGLVPLSEMSRTKRVNQADEVLRQGEEISVLIKDINPETRRISLSIKDAEAASEGLNERENVKDYQSQMNSQASDSSMGDLASKLQAALDKTKK
jgi:ribosomal protein S1